MIRYKGVLARGKTKQANDAKIHYATFVIAGGKADDHFKSASKITRDQRRVTCQDASMCGRSSWHQERSDKRISQIYRHAFS